MRRWLVLGWMVAMTGCAASSSSDSAPMSDAPADDQAEEEVVSGVTKIASKLQDPSALTAYGDSIYFVTNYGFATQEEAEYWHDVWVKTGTARAKRLYKGIYGASWGLVATKNGLYDVNQGYASIMRLDPAGGKGEGDSILHASYDEGDYPEVGITALAGDDDGIVVGTRTSSDETKPADVIALTPAGKGQKKLGTVTGYASALAIVGADVYVGTFGGEVFVAPRDGSSAMKKVATGEGKVNGIAVAGEDVFFGTESALFAQRKGAAKVEKLVPERASSLLVVGSNLTFAQWNKGLASIPLAGGATKIVLKTSSPSSTVSANGFVFLTDESHSDCRNTDEGVACKYDGAAFRLKL